MLKGKSSTTHIFFFLNIKEETNPISIGIALLVANEIL